MYASHFSFVYVTAENQVSHVGYGSDGSTIVEGVTHDDRVTYLDGDIQNQSVNRRTNQRAAEGGTAFGDKIVHNFQVVFGCLQLFACLFGGQECLFVLFAAYEFALVEFFHAFQVCFCLFAVDGGQTHAAFGRVELSQFRNHFDFSDNFACFHGLSGFLVDFGYDTRNLWFDLYFIAWFYLSRRYGGLYQGISSYRRYLVDSLFGL